MLNVEKVLMKSTQSSCPAGRGLYKAYPVFEAVRVPALFAAQVDEEMRRSGCVLWRHIPHDAEGITGHLTDLDVARSGERGVHFCHLPLY